MKKLPKAMLQTLNLRKHPEGYDNLLCNQCHVKGDKDAYDFVVTETGAVECSYCGHQVGFVHKGWHLLNEQETYAVGELIAWVQDNVEGEYAQELFFDNEQKINSEAVFPALKKLAGINE